MSLRSLLGIKDKRNEGPLVNPHPKSPSNRDILEDVENIKKNDPILSLAAILRKSVGRHSVVDTDIKELMEAMQKRKRRESQSSQPSSPTASGTALSFLRLSTEHLKVIKKKGKDVIGREDHYKNDNSEEEEEEDYDITTKKLDYDKLKHFLTTCDHSQELIGAIESEFKQFQAEVTEHYKQEQLKANDSNLL